LFLIGEYYFDFKLTS